MFSSKEAYLNGVYQIQQLLRTNEFSVKLVPYDMHRYVLFLSDHLINITIADIIELSPVINFGYENNSPSFLNLGLKLNRTTIV